MLRHCGSFSGNFSTQLTRRHEGGMNFLEVCVPPPPVYIEFYGDIAVGEDNMTPNTACLAFNATK